MSVKKKIFIIPTLFLLLMPIIEAAAERYPIDSDIDVSWETGEIIITARADVPIDSDNLTTERFKISESIDRSLTEIAADAFEEINMDSLITVRNFLKQNQQRMTNFDSFNYSLRKSSSSFSRDFSSVVNVYKYSLFSDIIPLLADHSKTARIPVVLDYEPTAKFTGIVIYAADPLPLWGENEEVRVKPAVFPKIFDENMNLVASAEMVPPEVLTRWGFAGYTEEKESSAFEERVGGYPLFTTAVAVFGINETDILIREDAARKLLCCEENRRLIREGRILIIGNFDSGKDPG